MQPARRLQEHVEDLAPRPRPALEPRRQRVALDELHRDVDVAVVGRADVVDADDVGMESWAIAWASRAAASRASFAFDAEARAQELERDLAIELRIVGGEHDAHAAGAERRQHEVAADPIADRQSASAARRPATR